MGKCLSKPHLKGDAIHENDGEAPITPPAAAVSAACTSAPPNVHVDFSDPPKSTSSSLTSTPSPKKKKIFSSVLNETTGLPPASPSRSSETPRAKSSHRENDEFTLGAFNPLARHGQTPRETDIQLPQFELIDLGQEESDLSSGPPPRRPSLDLVPGSIASQHRQTEAGNISARQDSHSQRDRERTSFVAFDLVYVSSETGYCESFDLPSTNVATSMNAHSSNNKNPLTCSNSEQLPAPFPNASVVGVPLITVKHRDNVARSPKVGPLRL